MRRFPLITLHGVCEHRGGLYVRRFGHETVEKSRICPSRSVLIDCSSAITLDSTSVRALAQSINTDPEGANS